MGNVELIERGGIQFTSAGKGIMHSEYNHSKPISSSSTSSTPNQDADSFFDNNKRIGQTPIAGLGNNTAALPEVERGKEVHFLQLWCRPNKKQLDPSYQTRVFSDEQKRNNLCQLISPKVCNIRIVI